MSENKVAARLKAPSVQMLKRLLVAGACVLPVLSTNVHAAAYAVSYTSITGFNMGMTNAAFGGFTSTISSATLGPNGTAHADNLDAASSCINCTYNNSFSSHGMGANSSIYGYGDSAITSTNMANGTGAASSIGEAAVINGSASGEGSNGFTGWFTVGTNGGSVDFSFNALTYLWAELTSGGQSAKANSSFTISITDSNYSDVFSWTPAGVNKVRSQTAVGVNSFTPSTAASYSTGAIQLAEGTYEFNIDMMNHVNVQSAQVVPLPAASWLLLSGLAGLVTFARKARK